MKIKYRSSIYNIDNLHFDDNDVLSLNSIKNYINMLDNFIKLDYTTNEYKVQLYIEMETIRQEIKTIIIDNYTDL